MNDTGVSRNEFEFDPEKERQTFILSYIDDPEAISGGRYHSAKEVGGEDFAEASSEGTLSYAFTSLYFLIKDMASKEVSDKDVIKFWEIIAHGGRHRGYLDAIPRFKKINVFMSELWEKSQVGLNDRLATDFKKLYSEVSALREEFNIRGAGYLSFGEKLGISEEKLLREKFKYFTKKMSTYLGKENGWFDIGPAAKIYELLTQHCRDLSIKIVDSYDDEDYDFDQLKKDFETVVMEIRTNIERGDSSVVYIILKRYLDEFDHFTRIISDK